MSDDPWARGTFVGTERAQAAQQATLSPEERVALLEQLLEVALESGALRRSREDKQRALDLLWAGT